MAKKEIDDELRKADPDFMKRQGADFACLKYVVGYRWNQRGGNLEEARFCYGLFDKKEKGSINAGDLKNVLSNYLEFPVNESDINEFIAMCNPDGSGNINFQQF